MKKFIYTSAIMIMANLFNAQDYTIKMNIHMEGLPAEYAAYGEQDIIAYSKGEKYRSEMSGMMFSSMSFSDGKNVTVLTESMGNKTGFTATKDEMEAAEKKEKSKKDDKPVIEYTTEKKTIAGYECTKAILTYTDKDKKVSKVNVWFTEQLKSKSGITKRAVKRMFELGELKGEPLAIEATQIGDDGTEIKMIMTTTEILTTAIDDALFVPSTEGYTMSSYSEWTEKMKAMRGGK